MDCPVTIYRVPDHEPDYASLGNHVRLRREELGLSQDDVKLLGGPSTATQRKIERGDPADYRLQTTWPLERVFGWRPGAINGFLRGFSGALPDVAVEPDYSEFRRTGQPPTVTETVGVHVDDGTELRYRRPEGMGDEQWERIRARGQAYIEGLLDAAAQER